MKRVDRVYEYILEKSKEYTKEDLLKIKGISAAEIEKNTGILRSNVSRELNTLCRCKKAVKIKNYPILYFERNYFQKILDIELPCELEEIENIDDFIKCDEREEDNSPFRNLIGYESSLKNQIDQAKAALMYPPNGLHTLIIGSTGVGKSLFANIMYQYYKKIKNRSCDVPFIVFNCADYYNNSQLLLSYIFGYVKGAFTGADKDKEGIIEKADGGILFLDEIHRLPPEGQEMIFYFMDTGTYNKLGESGRGRKANVLLIGATTENPKSTLLNTFIRRIPITITIPDFQDRPLKEKIQLINYLISKEAQRVNKSITIDSDVIKALIGSASYGNVGQLKSNIQLMCAKGFLDSIKYDGMINIAFKSLTNEIREGILNFKEETKGADIIPNSITINPDGQKIFLEAETDESNFNIYKVIENKLGELLQKGENTEKINENLIKDIDNYLHKYYKRFKFQNHKRDGILKIVSKEIVEFTEKIKIMIEQRMNTTLNDRFVYSLSLHLSSLFTRIKNNEFNNLEIDFAISTDSDEYILAKEIYVQIKNNFNVIIPNVEIKYLALLIHSLKNSSQNEKVGIVVVAHGDSTATSMVNFAKKLFSIDNIIGVDMPFESTLPEILDYTMQKVIEADEGKGVLMLVDMGSLNGLGEKISNNLNINVKSISMVSTPIVLEAVRKVSLSNNDLDLIYKNLIHDFEEYRVKYTECVDDSKEKVIVTVCSTGKGAAEKLKNIVKDYLEKLQNNIEVISIGLNDFNKKIIKLSEERNIVAVIGITEPIISRKIPFIPIEKLIDGTGEIIIKNIIDGKYQFSYASDKEYKNDDLEKVCKETINEFTTFLNSDKIYPLLCEFIKQIEKLVNKKYDNMFKLRLMIHIACAIERILLNGDLKYESDYSELNTEYIRIVKEAEEYIERAISIKLTDDEVYYIVSILESFDEETEN